MSSWGPLEAETPHSLLRDWFPCAGAVLSLAQTHRGRPQTIMEAGWMEQCVRGQACCPSRHTQSHFPQGQRAPSGRVLHGRVHGRHLLWAVVCSGRG